MYLRVWDAIREIFMPIENRDNRDEPTEESFE